MSEETFSEGQDLKYIHISPSHHIILFTVNRPISATVQTENIALNLSVKFNKFVNIALKNRLIKQN